MSDPLAEAMSERDLQDAIVELAQRLGWLVYHTHNSRHSASGFPDLTMAQPGRLIFAELKREDGHPTGEQIDWFNTLSTAGARCYIWRPSDWRDGTIERILT